jgi:hypothetical protein
MDWKISFENELATAAAVRERGNEGMARVCARRAAGAAVGEYLQRNQLPNPNTAYDRLRWLAANPEISPEIQALAGRFLVRITPEHELPIDADLLADARKLAELLLDHRS